MTKEELLDVFNAEPTKLTKQELIDLGGFVGVKLTMRSKEATMIKKLSEAIVPADDEPADIEVEVVDPEIEEAKPIVPQMITGKKPLGPDKVYSLNLSQRTALRKRGESVSTIPRKMTGSELMKFPNWGNLGL